MSDLSYNDPRLEAPAGTRVDSVAEPVNEPSEPQSTEFRTSAAEDLPPSEDRTAGSPLVLNGERFRTRWASIQVGFVDDPRRAVGEAERLVTDVIDELVEGFRRQRERLEESGEGSTDEMRTAFQRYRDFFQRLLNV